MFKETKFTQFPVFPSKRLFSAGREVYAEKPKRTHETAASIIKKQKEKAAEQQKKAAKKVAKEAAELKSLPGLRKIAGEQASEVLKAQNKLKPLVDRLKKLGKQKQNISVELVKDFIRAEANLKVETRKLLGMLSKIRGILVKLKKFKEANLVKIKAVLKKARERAKKRSAKPATTPSPVPVGKRAKEKPKKRT